MKTDRTIAPLAILLLAASAVVLWSYGTTLVEVYSLWMTDPQYSHGFLVPLFSLYLLWSRRRYLAGGELRARWWGVAIVGVAVAMRFAGHVFFISALDTGSLIVCLLGLAAAVGGRKALAWATPGILFLAFMLPLPHRAQVVLGGTLQRVATVTSTYALQTLGVPAVSEGNVILLTETRLGVEEACNGLSMLMTFLALATAVAILAERSLVEKIVIVLSAVPIAILANVTRITVTGLLYEASQGELARIVFHDLAGWLMMPLALVMLLVELWIFGRTFVPVPIHRPGGPRRTAAAAR